MADEPPPLEDFEPVLRGGGVGGQASGGMAPPATAPSAAGGAATRGSIVPPPATEGNKHAGSSLADREFLTDWGTPEQEALQKQMIDAALARNPEYVAEKAAETKAVTEEFGSGWGLKKGFLLGGKGGGSGKKTAPAGVATKPAVTSTRPAPTGTPQDPIVVKPAAVGSGGSSSSSSKSSLVLDEVQEAMASVRLAAGDPSTWMTPDFLGKVSANPKLAAALTNPKFMTAVAEMSSNPAAAAEKYKADVEVQDFFRVWMGVLGDHFTKLGAAQAAPGGGGGGSGTPSAAATTAPVIVKPAGPKATGPRALIAEVTGEGTGAASGTGRGSSSSGVSATSSAGPKALASRAGGGGGGGRRTLPIIEEDEDASVRRILSDPVMLGILRDPAMQRVMEECRMDGSKLKHYMAIPEVRAKLLLLQRAGLIRIEL